MLILRMNCARIPDLLETLVLKSFQSNCWRRVSRFASRGFAGSIPATSTNQQSRESARVLALNFVYSGAARLSPVKA